MDSLLNNPEFIRWCHKWITEVTLATTSNTILLKPYAIEESLWGNKIIRGIWNKTWTITLCQEAVREALLLLWYKNVRNGRKIASSVRSHKYAPDLESDEFVWEVKWRSWTTPGTAGEKILWTPIKYSEIPRLYWKPLKIVVVWYQEYEARNWFACGDLVDNGGKRTLELKKILSFHENEWIEYVAFTDLLKELSKKGLIPEYY